MRTATPVRAQASEETPASKQDYPAPLADFPPAPPFRRAAARHRHGHRSRRNHAPRQCRNRPNRGGRPHGPSRQYLALHHTSLAHQDAIVVTNQPLFHNNKYRHVSTSQHHMLLTLLINDHKLLNWLYHLIF